MPCGNVPLYVQPNCRRRLCRRRYICVTIMKIGWGEGTMRNFPVDRIRPFLMVNDGKKVAANRVITNTLCTYFKIVLYGEVEVPHTHQLCICHQSFEETYRSWLCRWNLGNGNRLLRGIVLSRWTAVLNCREAKVVALCSLLFIHMLVIFTFICLAGKDLFPWKNQTRCFVYTTE